MSHSGSAQGGQLEEKVDLSAETEAKLAQAESLVSGGQVTEALALLTAMEKKCRVGNDNPSLVKVCQASLTFCKDDIELLLSTLHALCVRRSQKTAAIQAMVQQCLPWVVENDYEPRTDVDAEYRNALVKALRDITDGKIFLEAQRAQLTRALATIKEQQGDIDAAASIMQEIHVETYGSLSKKDKVEFILEQMRLTLAKKDYIRAHIVSNKINRKVLAEMEEEKVRFFTLLADYHLHEQDALELAKDFYSVYSTPCILADTSKWQPALQKTILYLALAPYSNEQQDLMHKIRAEHEDDVVIVGFLKLLLTAEIIGYPLPQQAQLESLMDGDEWKEMLYRRVIQHNIRTASKYYQRITLTRLAQLLRLTEERCEQEIASMIADLDYCKMDRPNKIVKFVRPKNPDAVLTEWASDIETLLGLVEKTTHLISKEYMTTTTTTTTTTVG